MAIKIIDKKKLKTNEASFMKEIEILKSLDHPNIIKFYEVYRDQTHYYIC